MSSLLTGMKAGRIEQAQERGDVQRAVPERPRRGRQVNVGLAERGGSALLGAAMVAWGVMAIGRGKGWVGSVMGGLGLAATGASLVYRGVRGYCPGYQAVGVDASDASVGSHPLNRFIHVSRRVWINRSPADLYGYWRDIERLPEVMQHLKGVRRLDETRSRWSVAAARGRSISWDAELTTDRPNELIAWRSTAGSRVPNHGHVRFERASPGGGGTIMELSLHYRPPGGAVGAAVAAAFGRSAEQQLRTDLRQFKQRMEAGEVATTIGQPRGRCARQSVKR